MGLLVLALALALRRTLASRWMHSSSCGGRDTDGGLPEIVMSRLLLPAARRGGVALLEREKESKETNIASNFWLFFQICFSFLFFPYLSPSSLSPSTSSSPSSARFFRAWVVLEPKKKKKKRWPAAKRNWKVLSPAAKPAAKRPRLLPLLMAVRDGRLRMVVAGALAVEVEGEGVGVDEAVEVALEFFKFIFSLFLALASRFLPRISTCFSAKKQRLNFYPDSFGHWARFSGAARGKWVSERGKINKIISASRNQPLN